ncbi:MAG: DUF615 domain-containing protein [Burkholderiales bacterium]|jgi:ribosome-associated protein|nr:DUF615 domain-containing protein [Burkholderiales bacterium]
MTEPVSKTRRKQAMHEVQALGKALVDIPSEKLRLLGLPEALFDAIGDAKRITKHEARRRQIQFIGRLMRDVDPAPIAAFLEAQKNGSLAQKTELAAVESWRSRLLTDPDALLAWRAAMPDIDLEQWQTLIARARKGVDTPDGKLAYRALFKDIKKRLTTLLPADDLTDKETP